MTPTISSPTRESPSARRERLRAEWRDRQALSRARRRDAADVRLADLERALGQALAEHFRLTLARPMHRREREAQIDKASPFIRHAVEVLVGAGFDRDAAAAAAIRLARSWGDG